jgi:hypothetical protein
MSLPESKGRHVTALSPSLGVDKPALFGYTANTSRETGESGGLPPFSLVSLFISPRVGVYSINVYRILMLFLLFVNQKMLK